MKFSKKNIYILSAVLLLLTACSLIIFILKINEIREQKHLTAKYTKNIYQKVINERLKTVCEDIYYLSVQSGNYINIERGLYFTERMINAFGRRRGIYERIQLIDNNGKTIINASYPFNNVSENLTDTDKPLLDELLKLKKDDILIGDFLLISKGYSKNTLTLYMPVLDEELNNAAYIKLELNFSYITSLFDNENVKMTYLSGLINNDGYMIYLNPSYDYKGNNIEKLFPKLYNSIKNENSKIINDKLGSGCYNTIYPFGEHDRIVLPNDVSVNINYIENQRIKLHLVSFVFSRDIFNAVLPTILWLVIGNILFIMISVILLILYDKIMYKNKKAELNLFNITSRYEDILLNISNPIVIFDKNFTITYVNRKFIDLTGYTKDKLINHNLRDLILKDFGLEHLKDKKDIEVIIKHRNGNFIYTIFSPNFLKDSDMQFNGALCLINDITLMKIERERLVEESYIFENNPGLVFWTDQYGNLIKANNRGQDYFDKKKGINNIYSLLTEADKSRIKEKNYSFEQLLNEVYYTVNVKHDESSNTFFYYCYDISRLKIVEKALVESNALNKSLLNNIPFAMRIVNRTYKELYKKEGVDISIDNIVFWDFLDEYDRDTNFNNMSNDNDFNIGSDHYEIFRTPFYYDNDDSVLEIIQNITERKKNADVVRMLSIGIEQSANPILITDNKGVVSYANAAFEKISGYKREYIIGKTPKIVNSGSHDKDFYKKLWTTIKSGIVWTGEFLNKRADGTLYWERAVITPIKDSMGQVTNFIAVKEDITKAREAEELLKKAKDDAEKDSVLKSEFLANMSHEIRTPMNAIIGYTDILIEEEDDNDKKEKLAIIKNSGNNLLNLINDILDLSKIEAGKIIIDSDVFSVSRTCDFVISLVKNKAAEKNIDLFLQIDRTTPESVRGDERHITQIIVNLLSNAVKFTSKGSVILAVSYIQPNLIINVIDTGIGIENCKLTNIFNAFEQADSSTERNYGGTGLGLTISKKLSGLMGGNIIVESEVGKGSKFTVFIPVIPENAEVKNNDPIDIDGIVKEWMELWKDQPEIERIFHEAINRLPDFIERLESSGSDDVMLKYISHEMKGVYGNLGLTQLYEIACEIEEELKNPENTDYYRINELKENIKDISNTVNKSFDSRIVSSPENNAGVNNNFNILLAEDNKINQKLISTMLDKMNFSCSCADNGKIALEMLESKDYRLLLLDMQMPIMDGLGVLHSIKNNHKFADLYIIAITANAITGDKEKYIAEGCNDYISKPIDRNEFEKKIKKAADFIINTNKKDVIKTIYDYNDIEALESIVKIAEQNISIFKPASVLSAAAVFDKISAKDSRIDFIRNLFIEAAGSFNDSLLLKALEEIKEILIEQKE